MGGVLTATLLALAGIPLTVGFIAKFYAVEAGISAAMWLAIFALVVGSVIGLFYYLRIIVVMAAPAQAATAPGRGPLAWTAYPALAILTIALIWLGVYPTPLIALIRLTALHVG